MDRYIVVQTSKKTGMQIAVFTGTKAECSAKAGELTLKNKRICNYRVQLEMKKSLKDLGYELDKNGFYKKKQKRGKTDIPNKYKKTKEKAMEIKQYGSNTYEIRIGITIEIVEKEKLLEFIKEAVKELDIPPAEQAELGI